MADLGEHIEECLNVQKREHPGKPIKPIDIAESVADIAWAQGLIGEAEGNPTFMVGLVEQVKYMMTPAELSRSKRAGWIE
jgi:hypothetical protein